MEDKTKALVERFTTIKNSIETNKVTKVRLETQLEELNKNRETKLAELLNLAGVTTIEEVDTVIAKLEQEVSTMLAEAEAILNAETV